jgi:ferrous iron transport protein B
VETGTGQFILTSGFRDEIVKSLYIEAEKVARRAVKTASDKKFDLDQKLDHLVTSPITGLPIMLLLLAAIIWLTVSGANVASDAITALWRLARKRMSRDHRSGTEFVASCHR